MTASDTHRTIDAVWRIESPKLIAGLTRLTRDVGLAEDLAQDARLAALERCGPRPAFHRAADRPRDLLLGRAAMSARRG